MSRHQLLSPLTLAAAIIALAACGNPTGPQSTPSRSREVQSGDDRRAGGGKRNDDTVKVHPNVAQMGERRRGRGVDDIIRNALDSRRGRGTDDRAGDDRTRGGQGADDPAGDDRNRGARHDDVKGRTTERVRGLGRHGADDATGDDRGRGGHGADDGPNHG